MGTKSLVFGLADMANIDFIYNQHSFRIMRGIDFSARSALLVQPPLPMPAGRPAVLLY